MKRENKVFKKDLEDFLNAWGILELATYRTKHANYNFNQIPRRSITLWGAFCWDETPEGFDFWSSVVEMYKIF